MRKTERLASVEGIKEMEMALEGGMIFHSLYFVQSMVPARLFENILDKFPEIKLYEINELLYAKTAYRESSGGMIAIIETKINGLNDIQLKKNPLVLIIDGVEKPGNIGAILRTADAAAVDVVVFCDMPGELYNPNTIRASLGTVFTVPLVNSNGKETRLWLKKNKIRTYCSDLNQSNPYHLLNYTGPTALVMGTESTGVTNAWLEFADNKVKIPMLGKIDSMNVSVATAILLFEARRQRIVSDV